MCSVVITDRDKHYMIKLNNSMFTDDNYNIQRHQQISTHTHKVPIVFLQWHYPQVTSIYYQLLKNVPEAILLLHSLSDAILIFYITTWFYHTKKTFFNTSRISPRIPLVNILAFWSFQSTFFTEHSPPAIFLWTSGI